MNGSLMHLLAYIPLLYSGLDINVILKKYFILQVLTSTYKLKIEQF